MVVAFVAIAKSVGQQCLKRSKPYSNSYFSSYGVQKWQFQSHRTLILQSASESVKLERLSDSDSGILEVKLDRPEARNAIGKDMLRGLQQAFEAVSNERSANVLMICSSVPKVFCAGADLKERKTMILSEVQDFVSTLRSTFSYLEALHIPTIAAIEGIALGGGLEMAMSCDIRICGEDAVMGLPETGLAIIPGAGGTQRLPRLVGKSIAKDIIFTGRKISGKDAGSIGTCLTCHSSFVKRQSSSVFPKLPPLLSLSYQYKNEGDVCKPLDNSIGLPACSHSTGG
uniref:Methylglutaconyl-CoA hydratase, mitochondrial n=1 Tax=Solanum tuberosum TaxID=4113 RepID=M1CHB0_SOLTU